MRITVTCCHYTSAYSDDVDDDDDALKAQLSVFKVLMESYQPSCFVEMAASLKEFSPTTKAIIYEVLTVCNLVLVNPATSATAERSF